MSIGLKKGLKKQFRQILLLRNIYAIFCLTIDQTLSRLNCVSYN
jgi:hypothetical protein